MHQFTVIDFGHGHVGDQWLRNFSTKIETKQKKVKKSVSQVVLNDYSSNYAELIQSSGFISIETPRLYAIVAIVYNVFMILKDLNFNSEKSLSSCPFRKNNKVWKQNLSVTWGTYIEHMVVLQVIMYIILLHLCFKWIGFCTEKILDLVNIYVMCHFCSL